MNRVEALVPRLVRVFRDIQNEQMAGIPVLNHNLHVEAVGFTEFHGRGLGVLITSWLMNLMLFPALDEDWRDFKIGSRHVHEFPSGPRDFLINVVENLGVCQTHALYSPMSGFQTQAQAVAAAKQIMRDLLIRVELEEKLDEKRLERFINGEDMSQIRQSETGSGPEGHIGETTEGVASVLIARSDFLRGRFSGKKTT